MKYLGYFICCFPFVILFCVICFLSGFWVAARSFALGFGVAGMVTLCTVFGMSLIEKDKSNVRK